MIIPEHFVRIFRDWRHARPWQWMNSEQALRKLKMNPIINTSYNVCLAKNSGILTCIPCSTFQKEGKYVFK